MRVIDVIRDLEAWFPLELQEGWDNSGLIIGEKETLVRGVLLTLDVTLEVVLEAVEKGANLIISHHPVIMSGVKSVTDRDSQGALLLFLIKNGISVYCSHTPLDSALLGINYYLANKLKLENIEPLSTNSTIGVVGNITLKDNSITYFIIFLKEILGLKICHYTDKKSVVKRVAICSGSGASFVSNAVLQGADTFITGDVKYHQYLENMAKINIIDIGHFESEIVVIDILYSLFIKKIYTFAISKTKYIINPIKVS